MIFKKILLLLALWFLGEWVFTTKLKPFLKSELGIVIGKDSANTATTPDGGAAGNSSSPANIPGLVDTGKKNLPVPGMNSGSYVSGIDISKYEGDEANLLARKKNSLVFVICKATEGLTIKDVEFHNNWKLLKQKNFIRGAYHFYHCNDDPIKQVDFFLRVTDTFSKNDFPPVIDIEETSFSSRCSDAQIEKNILIFLKELEKRTGRRPVIYTDNNVGNSRLNDTAFAKYPLWIAYYGKKAPLPVPAPWKKKVWAMWQKSESYSLWGYEDDYDLFNGDIVALRLFVNRH